MSGIDRVGPDFEDWDRVLSLILDAFAYMAGRIDPPSSAHRLTTDMMAAEATTGAVFIAEEAGVIQGCLFCQAKSDALYLGKLAVRPDHQGRGIGKTLMAAAEAEARARGLHALELQTRIELSENHAAFEAMGFERIGTTAHPGFDRPTSVTMRRVLDEPD